MDQLNTAAFCAAFFSIMFVLALLVRENSRDSLVVPNSARPKALDFINFQSTQAVPWTTFNGSKVDREQKCKKPLCESAAYIIQLPILENPERPTGTWDPISNAWTLSAKYFETGLPQSYPFATVVRIPQNTPEHVRFILPDQLRPSTENELNITGNYENAFVLINLGQFEIYFYRNAQSYWTLSPGSKTLMWPTFTSKSSSWSASSIDKTFNDAQAAYHAELLMISRLNDLSS